ncbi:uncharacterized protein LOC124316386 [Daphnia pulicaria]|uniref:uncharacterized protein LOC124316386 n=1 Tax=Daphnia pulicaria TaxID=35523 RepID=UPI001EEA754B|nr:uncharacterized protein LOC124316386 [Daphnia pulicaria]
MFPKSLQQLFNRHNARLTLILLAIASFGLVVKNVSFEENELMPECSADDLQEEDYYVSSLCNCGKKIPIKSNETAEPDAFQWCSTESSARGHHQRIVTYALFGNAHNASVFRRYYSNLRNISLTVEKQYPGYVIRIYHNVVDDPDSEGYRQLCNVYCRYPNVDLCSVPELADRIGDNSTTPIDPVLIRGLNPRMYRYLVMLDPNVDLFISRDVDSLIFQREVDAVRQWLPSNYTFHLMRDHKGHGSIILAGMFGVKLDQRRDLVEGLARALILSGQNIIGHQDQASLDRIVWPVAKYDVMAHDSYHCQNPYIVKTSVLKVFPFPTKRNGRYYIGGAGHELYPEICPIDCRPPDHQDWEYC